MISLPTTENTIMDKKMRNKEKMKREGEKRNYRNYK